MTPRRALTPLLLALTLAAPARGQDPAPVPIPPAPRPTRIVLPDSILPYRLVEIRATGEFDSCLFDIEPDELASYRENGDNSATMTGPPGRYVVKVTTIKDGKLGKARAVFVIPGPIPGPTPTPDPDDGKPRPKPVPPPPPAPPLVTGVLNASLVVDLDTLTPELAALREAVNVRAAFPSEFHYRVYAASNPDVARLNLTQYVAKAGGPPVLVIQDSAGKVIAAEKATDEAAIIARVKAIRGTK